MASGLYNPLDKKNLGKSVAEALIESNPCGLGELRNFVGAGIYAIYYKGDFPAYGRLRELNADDPRVPIYVGKAIPRGGRKGLAVLSDDVEGHYLYSRLEEHAESIKRAENLDLKDFLVRWLVVDDIWIPLGETLMIQTFRPIWNQALDGFGNHDPGRGRYNGYRPMWDTLHPGRDWADKCQARPETQEDLVKRVRAFLEAPNMPGDDPSGFASRKP